MRSGLSAFLQSASVLGLVVGCGGAAISMWIDSDKNAQRSDLTSHHTPRLSKNRETSNTPRQRVAKVEWADRVRTEEFWRELRSPQSRPSVSQPQRAVRSQPEKQRATRASTKSRSATEGQHTRRQDHGIHRTVCVRMCDGYFWPISSSADSTSIAHDRKQCEQSCETPARLYVSKDIDGQLEDMRDEAGRHYRGLKTAFVYRSVYLPDCKCKAHPWEEEARARHDRYAKQVGPITAQTVRRR
jgi:Protein of unknown function (DUF2865)